ncbi:MAG: helix-hairpin-helix domain-containing protein, partial [bacterium]|nr:helix-hairpin-helix domain-containing protein [bacterium]
MNKEISNILYDISKILEFNGENIFRVRAYQNAARIIESYHKDVSELSVEELKKISGIGEGIAKKIVEYCKTKTIKEYDELKKKIPNGVLEIMELHGVGPKRAKILYEELKIDSVEKLKKAAQEGKLRSLKGFGKKTENNILKALELKTSNFILLWDAIKISDSIIKLLKKTSKLKEIETAGSIRRRKEKIGDIDILAVSDEPLKVIEQFTKIPEIQSVLAKGDTKSQILLKNGIQCDLRVVDEKSYGSALMYFTGSKEHNIVLRELALKKNYTLSEYGLFTLKDKKYVAGRTEDEVYKKLGLYFIPPELRENTGEVEFAMKSPFPKFVEITDIKGDFHTHTKRTDGFNSDEEMILKAIELGYEYVAIGDHTKSTRVAGGLTE